MLNSITAHIKFIHGKHIFGEIIPYRIIYPKLPLYRFFRCKQIGHLNVEFLPSLITDKIYFLILIFADRNMISAAEQFQIYNVFKRQINILCSRRTQPPECRDPQYNTFHWKQESACLALPHASLDKTDKHHSNTGYNSESSPAQPSAVHS